MLDIFSVSKNLIKKTLYCKVVDNGAHSDNSVVQLDINTEIIKHKNDKGSPKIFNCNEINEDPYLNKELNDRIKQLNTQNVSYTEFIEIILDSVKKTTLTNKHENKGWFNYSVFTLEENLQNQGLLLHQIRSTSVECEGLLKELKIIRVEAEDAVTSAKMLWFRKLDEDAHNMRFNPKLARKKINEISKRLSGNHFDPKTMRMSLTENKFTVNDEVLINLISSEFSIIIEKLMKIF